MANAGLFDKWSLKSALFCSLLMASVDGSFDVAERNVCLAFLNDHWKPDYGSAKDFFLDTVKEVKPYIGSRSKIDQKITDLSDTLNDQQKQAIIGVVEKVMMADKQVLVTETELFNRIKKLNIIRYNFDK